MRNPIKPCWCGCENLIIWRPSSDPHDMTSLEKIECTACGTVVYGCGEDEIESWNAGEYDEKGVV